MDRDFLANAKENIANKASFNGREYYCSGEAYNAIGIWLDIDWTSMEEGPSHA